MSDSILILFGLLCLGGWIANVVKIVETCCQVIDGLLVVRIIGVFVAPIGAVLGFF